MASERKDVSLEEILLSGAKIPPEITGDFNPLCSLPGFSMPAPVAPALHEIARARAIQIATQSINKAVREEVVPQIRYEDLITVKVDNRGRVVLMQPNTGDINRLASEATIAVQKELEKVSRARIHIPLGQLLGSQVMAGRGPDIPIEIIPAGAVESRVFDRFEQAGINQTRHKIYLEIKTRVRIVIPLTFANAEVRTEVPLAEAVIMGEVPQVYFGGPPVLNLPQNPLGSPD